MTFTCSVGKYRSQLFRPLLFCVLPLLCFVSTISRPNYWRIHCWNFKIQPGLILLIIISSVQNYACEVDCTDHYHIAFEQNAMPVLVRTFTISILGELPKSTNFSKLFKIYFCNFMWPAESNLIYYYFRLV